MATKKIKSVLRYSLDWHPADHVSFFDNVHLRPLTTECKVSVLNTILYSILVIVNVCSNILLKSWSPGWKFSEMRQWLVIEHKSNFTLFITESGNMGNNTV